MSTKIDEKSYTVERDGESYQAIDDDDSDNVIEHLGTINLDYTEADEHTDVKLTFKAKDKGTTLKALGDDDKCTLVNKSGGPARTVWAQFEIPKIGDEKKNPCEVNWKLGPTTPKLDITIKLKRR